MNASHGIGRLALRQGDLSRALPLLERAVGLCHEADLQAGSPWWRTLWVRRIPYPGASPTRAAAHTSDGTGHGKGKRKPPVAWSFPRKAQMLAGHLKEAHALAERALAHAAGATGTGPGGVWPYASWAPLRRRREPPQIERAAAHYHQALALAEELGMRPLQAHCHRSLGTLYVATGQQGQAHTSCPWP